MVRMPKLIRFLSHLLFLFFIAYFINRKDFSPILKKKLNRYIPDIKYLLVWTKLHGLVKEGQKHFVDKKCDKLNCYFTTNKNLFGDIGYFDGIIFNLQDVSEGIQQLPRFRGYNQKYVFAANDSADNYPVCDPVYENFFNWTWTYRADSTVPYRFISVYNLHNEELGNDLKWAKMDKKDENMKRELASKSKAAAIFLDKCTTRSKREIFLKELQIHLEKYNMTLDIFGKCGTVECRRKTMKPCLWKVKKYYFFYLALEDSFAEDYLTKTVLYAYKNNAVPIVYGKADYQRFLPPDSYIDGLSLGAQKVAELMYQTVYDPSRYRQFFNWKSYYSIKGSEVLDICALCTAFNNPVWLTYSSTYPEFRKWWNPSFENRCAEDSMKKPFFSFG